MTGASESLTTGREDDGDALPAHLCVDDCPLQAALCPPGRPAIATVLAATTLRSGV